MSILTTTFSNLPIEQSLMQVVKITYFLTPWITFFLEMVLYTFSLPPRGRCPVHFKAPVFGMTHYLPGGLVMAMWHPCETFPMSTYKSQNNLGEVQGCLRERKRIWVWVTMLSSRLIWIRSGSGILEDFLVFVHSLAMVHQVPIFTHHQLTRGNNYCYWR